MRCIPVEVNRELVCLFVVYDKQDPLSTPAKFNELPESKLALKFKSLLFRHEDHKELATRTQWTTIADPLREWSMVSLHKSTRAAYKILT